MLIRDLEKLDDIEVLTNDNENMDGFIKGVYIGDLLSMVMSKALESQAWLTIQTHLNIIAVASLIEFSIIIIVEGMEVEEGTIAKANEIGIPIFRTNRSAYDMAKILASKGE